MPRCPACATSLPAGQRCACEQRSETRKEPAVVLGAREATGDGAITRLEPSLDPLIGKTIAGRFELLSLLRADGSSKTYRARQVGLDRQASVKLLRPAQARAPEVVARFEREARTVSRLAHENCAQVYDFGEHDGALYLAMEHVEGLELRTLLAQDHPLGVKRACLLTAQLLAGLSDAHAQGIVHRGLNLENVKVLTRRGEELVKVQDFGLARLLDPDEPALTAVGRLFGTPLYMSPEQATGAPADTRSDLYSVGVLLYQLLTGVVPFASTNDVEVLSRHVSEAPRAPSIVAPELRLPKRVDDLVLRALAKAPADRPRSASAFRAELLAIAATARELPQAPISPALQLTPVATAPVAPPAPIPEPAFATEPPAPTAALDDDDDVRSLLPPPAVKPAWLIGGAVAVVVLVAALLVAG